MRILFLLLTIFLCSCNKTSYIDQELNSVQVDTLNFQYFVYNINGHKVLYTWPKNDPSNYTIIELKEKD